MLAMSLTRRLGRGAMSLTRRLDRGAMLLPSHAVRLESGSTIGAVMCDQSRDVPAL
jgi:hypothetical protein